VDTGALLYNGNVSVTQRVGFISTSNFSDPPDNYSGNTVPQFQSVLSTTTITGHWVTPGSISDTLDNDFCNLSSHNCRHCHIAPLSVGAWKSN
jgi:hypothetical protein